MSKAAAALIMACAFVATPCLAQTSGATTDTGQTPEGWRGSITPYVWVVGVEGNVAKLPDGTGTDFDVTFNDITTHLSQGAFVGKGEIGYDKFGLMADIEYVKVVNTASVDIHSVLTIDTKAALKFTLGTVAGYYRAYDGPNYTVDVLAGVAINTGGVSVDLPGPLGRTAGGDIDHSWNAPIVGVRGTWQLNQKRVPLPVCWMAAARRRTRCGRPTRPITTSSTSCSPSQGAIATTRSISRPTG